MLRIGALNQLLSVVGGRIKHIYVSQSRSSGLPLSGGHARPYVCLYLRLTHCTSPLVPFLSTSPRSTFFLHHISTFVIHIYRATDSTTYRLRSYGHNGASTTTATATAAAATATAAAAALLRFAYVIAAAAAAATVAAAGAVAETAVDTATALHNL